MTEKYGLEEFVDEIRNVVSKKLADKDALAELSPGFQRLLANRSFLEEKLATMRTAADEVMLHSDPEGKFTVLARGVSKKEKKGKSHASVPHDHGPFWALYGLYKGTAQFQRYAPAPGSEAGPLPGLRLLSETVAKTGEFDAIPPHSMHLPVFPPEGSTILVVYNGVLESVQRRGYVASAKGVVHFQGVFPPLTAPTEALLGA